MGYCPIQFKDNLKTIEPRFPKDLRTYKAHSDFTGPYNDIQHRVSRFPRQQHKNAEFLRVVHSLDLPLLMR